GDAKFLAHLPRHPGIEGGWPRPGALVQAAEHDQIGLLQSRLDKAPDRKARMTAKGGAHDNAGSKRLDQPRVMPRGYRRESAGRLLHPAPERARPFPARNPPRPAHAPPPPPPPNPPPP